MTETSDQADTPDQSKVLDQIAGSDQTEGAFDSTVVRTTRRSIGKRLIDCVVAPPTYGGAASSIVFGWWSFQPTLMPRTAVVQAAITALCVSIGYALGTIAGRAVRYGLNRTGHSISQTTWRSARLALSVVAAAAVASGLALWLRWQNGQRDLLGMDHLAAVSLVPLVVAAVILIAILMTLGRAIGFAVRGLNRWNLKRLPTVVAVGLTIIIVFFGTRYLLRDIGFERFTLWADTTFGSVNETTDEDVTRPTSTSVSGSSQSLVSWDSLGRHGRGFVAGATSKEDMERFWGADAEFGDPVRAYVGDAAGSTRDRATLAVRELERAGGFDRDVLVVATATGSGWIDPDSARALEMMYRGDSAIVSMQYSFLPSWISFITDLDAAGETGTELFNAVHKRWLQLDASERPKLIVFGLSLGSYGAEFAFAGSDAMTSLSNVMARSDGALFVGPTNSNPMHHQFITDRDDGSTVWNPSFDKGQDVQFITRDPDRRPPKEPSTWPLVYVQHPSDPVTQWGFDWLWSSSAWNDRPRGYDVPDTGRWLPVVTWTQGVFDLMAGFSAPPGFGHDYRLDYVNAWSRVVPPQGWSPGDTERLESLLHDN